MTETSGPAIFAPCGLDVPELDGQLSVGVELVDQLDADVCGQHWAQDWLTIAFDRSLRRGGLIAILVFQLVDEELNLAHALVEHRRHRG